MRKVIIILLLCIPIAANAANYYVATNGNDGNPGTMAQPWATWQYGFNHISPGDILYIRGGTYIPTAIQTNSSRHCAVVISGKNGSSGSKYQVFAYPGETPILDCRNITSSTYERRGILILNSSYWHIKGLSVTRVDQAVNRMVGQGIEVWGISSCHHNTIENCNSYTNGGPGMGTRQYVNEISFLNCDVYDNYDPYSVNPGGNADGFDVGYSYNDGIVRLTGCRAWNNGDDGYDMYQGSGYSGIYYLANCWAEHHGYGPGGIPVGDGSGFKLGTSNGLQTDGVVRRFLYNCIAYDNRTWGFTQNTGNSKTVMYNCISYGNVGRGYDFSWKNQYDTFRNCISYANGSSDVFLSNVTHDHNSWDSGVNVTNADFLSTDGTELKGSRKADGSLPDNNFLHLATGSDLIDAGADVGIPFSGKAPDLGAFEQQASATTSTPPVFKSAVVENETPSLLALTYDLNLNNLVIPATSSFIVSVNSAAITVNSVAISGAKVQLNLASVIKSGDIIAVSYTKPANNPLQTVTGGVAASISSQTVINHISATTAGNTTALITMTISPNPVHRVINILFAYATSFSMQDPAASPQIIRILDLSGKLFVEKLLVTGIASIKFPINLRSGVYTVMVLSGGVNISSQKLLVSR